MSISAGDVGHGAESAFWQPGMPSPAADLHIASLDYLCTLSALQAPSGAVSFSLPDPARFTFAFETGQVQVQPGVFQVSWDFSWFDQTTVEADIAFAMSQIVAAVANMLGLTVGEVNEAVLIRRVWTYAPNLQGSGAGAGSGRVVTIDVMPYPPRASVDSSRGRESSLVAVATSGSDSVRGRDGAYGFGGDWVRATESASHVP